MASFSKICIFIISTLLVTKSFSVESSNEKPIIFWSSLNLPPGMCLNIKPEQPCFVNLMVSQLQKNIKNYKHMTFKSSLKRLISEFKDSEKLILAPALAYSKERDKFIEYSYSSPFPRLPYVVAMKTSNKEMVKPYLDSNQNIDIEKLLESPLRTVFFEGRSYGEFLDPIINKYKANQESIVQYSNIKAMKFLKLDRIDYLLIFPPHAKFAKNQLDDKEFSILTYPILGAPSYEVGRLGTSKSAHGKKLIKTINKLLYDDQIIQMTTKSYREWLPEELKKHFDSVSAQYQRDRILIDAINN